LPFWLRNMSSTNSYNYASSDELASSIFSSGTIPDLSTETQWVIHPASMPLASIVDTEFVLRRFGSEISDKVHQPFSAGGCASPRCAARGKSGYRSALGVPADCPCLRVCPDADPLCFIEFMVSMNRSIDGVNTSHVIDPTKVAFCTRFDSAFSSKYSGPLREILGFSSFENAKTREDLLTLLDCLYWYRTNDRLVQDMNKLTLRPDWGDIHRLKRKLKQTIYTIDTLVEQLCICMPEVLSYNDLNRTIAILFKKLLVEYMSIPTYENGIPVLPGESVYADIARFHKEVKASIQYGDGRWTNIEGGPTFMKTLGYYLRLERERANSAKLSGKDIHASLGGTLRKMLLSQKRGMGFVPEEITARGRYDFRANISREPEVWPDAKKNEVYTCLMDEFLAEMPECHGIFEKKAERNKRIIDQICSISVELKATASTETEASQGGKLEDARKLINLFRDQGWTAPKRDLRTGELLGEMSPPKEGDKDANISLFLFYLSLQVCVNALSRNDTNGERFKPFYRAFIQKDGTEWVYDPFRGRILYIEEPGKERRLITTTSVYQWVTSVYGKMMQTVMSESKSHKNGLIDGSPDWSHHLRVQGTREGKIFYDISGKLRPETVSFYSDLVESTDWLCKTLGMMVLIAFERYTSCFKWYGNVARGLYVHPIELGEEVVERSASSISRYPLKLTMSEGTPMGMGLAKGILHGAHFATMGMARKILAKDRRKLNLR